MDVIIREHRTSDKPFLRAMLETAAVPTYPELLDLGRISLRERLDAIFDQHYGHESKQIWVAETPDGRQAGMIWLQPSFHPVTEKADWMVINVAVAEPFQRQGIGRQLMAHARDFCVARGTKRMRLFVASSNEAAYQLYRELGFVDQTREMLWEL